MQLRFEAAILTDVCLGLILDPNDDVVDATYEILQKCMDHGIPSNIPAQSCGHYVCNTIRQHKLLDICPPREKHPAYWFTPTIE